MERSVQREKRRGSLVSVEEIIPDIAPAALRLVDGLVEPDPSVFRDAAERLSGFLQSVGIHLLSNPEPKSGDTIPRNTGNDYSNQFVPDLFQRLLFRCCFLNDEILQGSPAGTRLLELARLLRSLFSGQVVVDLGPGESPLAYFMVDLLGAEAYVGVEKHRANILSRTSISSTPEGKRQSFDTYRKRAVGAERASADDLRMIPAAVEDADMLSFLKRLPDASVSIFTSGIDAQVLPDGQYRHEVEVEIERVLHPEGVYFGFASDFRPELFRAGGFPLGLSNIDLLVKAEPGEFLVGEEGLEPSRHKATSS